MTVNFKFQIQVSFNESVYFNEVIQNHKTISKARSNLCLKMRLIEGLRTSEECALLKKKVSTTSLTKKYKKSNTFQNSLHVFKIYYRYWEDKKVNSFLIWLSHTLFYNIFTTLTCKINKFIKEFVEFINDLSITCSIGSTQVFYGYMCRIHYRKNVFFFKKSLTPLCSLCKFYLKNDCHLLDEYRHKTPLWST